MRTFAVDDVDDACGRPEPEPTSDVTMLVADAVADAVADV